MTVTLLPDAEALMTSFLRAQPEVSTIVGSKVTTAIPEAPTPPAADNRFPRVRVRRIAGFAVLNHPLHVDAPLVQLEAYAQTKGAARLLIETCRAVLAERVIGAHATGVVSDVRFGAMSWLPDEDFTPPKPRYVADCTITIHP